MQLHELNGVPRKRKKRVGRGGKRGTYSGRGLKGQKSRAGRRIRPAARDLILRLPKRRGFGNKPLQAKAKVFNLAQLTAAFAGPAAGREITKQSFKEAGLLPRSYRGEVKILAEGDLRTPLVLKGFLVSKGAREKIEKAGGRIMEEKQ